MVGSYEALQNWNCGLIVRVSLVDCNVDGHLFPAESAWCCFVLAEDAVR